MELSQEQQQALERARARARQRIAEAQAGGRPWEKFQDQGEGLKPWDRARLEQARRDGTLKPWERARLDQEKAASTSDPDMDEAFLWAAARKRKAEADAGGVDEELALARARARARAAQAAHVASEGKPWERFRDPQSHEVRVQNDFEELPWYGEAGRAAMDIARVGLDGASFGFGDKLLAGIEAAGRSDMDYDEALQLHRQATEDARTRSGLAGTTAEIGASFLPMNAAANVGVNATRLVPQGLSRAKTLAGKLAAGGIEGAGYGALHGAGHDEDIADAASIGALAGIGGTAAAQAVGGVAGKLAQALKRDKPQVPSSEALKTQAHASYKAADDAGVLIRQDSMNRLQADLMDDLDLFGFDPDLQAKSAVVLKRLQEAAGGHVTLSKLDAIRKKAFKAFGVDKSDNAALSTIIRHIDRHIDELGDGDILLGNAQAGAQAIKEARNLWRRASKSEAVESAIRDADFAQNPERTIRTQIGKLAKKGGMTPDEFTAAMDVAKGGPLRNSVTYAGRAFAPQSGALGAASSTAAVVSGVLSGYPSAVAAPVIGTGAKMLSDRMTKAKANRLAELMRAGGTREALEGPDNALQRLSKTKRDALARLLLSGELTLAP
ncbi:hypothetical protein [Microvirga zambiensis]|uniref:hypothetical protein n=1 Tax=Microvirga zambiensis TaxID=1402137 RepID=UPI00191F5B7C|nr:hypothetical protein [Microvirga zambiensis]